MKIHFKGDHNQHGKVTTVTSMGEVVFIDGFSEVSAEVGAHLLQMPKSFETVSEEAPQTSQEAPGATQTVQTAPTSQETASAAPKAPQTFKKK